MGSEITQKLAATVIPIFTHDGKPLQVLLGQAEVTNWLKSTPEQQSVMRYPGEFKFPGGRVDDTDASVCYTAVRELNEEFMLNLAPEDVCLRLFNVKTTKAIKGMQFIVHQFLALSEENPWLQGFESANLNLKLRSRREEFFSRHFNEDYASIPLDLREKIAPEVHRVEWFPLKEAIEMQALSMADELHPVNAFQQEEFKRCGVISRDPMYQVTPATPIIDHRVGSIHLFSSERYTISETMTMEHALGEM
ncbi:hypothetical protein CYMTET_48763 [Cymbomonas tetramitiformis]|uniref:Nudix hydrolase domain-containing protein n=1 Tax=Cymbomonas tetramitiformis TaxID=36881 RepID=A0AAE0BSP9_9CHLO|nr:hypothetical protein CYMTET_48763 [Cymbomonas tetramitiformis]